MRTRIKKGEKARGEGGVSFAGRTNATGALRFPSSASSSSTSVLRLEYKCTRVKFLRISWTSIILYPPGTFCSNRLGTNFIVSSYPISSELFIENTMCVKMSRYILTFAWPFYECCKLFSKTAGSCSL